MYCFNCGEKIEDNVKFCPYCGNELTVFAGSESKPENNSVAVCEPASEELVQVFEPIVKQGTVYDTKREMFESENRISNICTFIAIPGSACSFLAIPILLGLGSFWEMSDTGSNVLLGLIIGFYALSLLALIISSFTCGTLGYMFKDAGKAFLAIIRFPRVIVLRVIFFVIWLYIAALAFAGPLAAGLFCPAGAIAISAKRRRSAMNYAK